MVGNIITSALVIVCAFFFQCIYCHIDFLRVFQGRDAHPGEFPYAVALSIKLFEGTQDEFYKSFCTGSIITPIWTLTAGHCIRSIQELPSSFKLFIRYKISSENQNPQWGASEIISFLIHPGFKMWSLGKRLTIINDIGLLKTNKTFVTTLGKLSSVNYRTLYGHKVSIAGFGAMKTEIGIDDALALNKSLQVNEVIVTKCQNLEATIRPLFCLSWECKKPTMLCSGDSGGPVIHPSGIIAVNTASAAGTCGMMKRVFNSGIVTPISPFLNWIVKNIKDT